MFSLMANAAARLSSDRPSAPASLERRAAGGERHALETLLREHGADVIRLCEHLVGPQEGRDVAQQAFERIVTQARRFDPERGTFRSWALAIARNLCRDRMRRRGLERSTFVKDGAPADDEAAAGTPSPERAVAARMRTEQLAGALETLPEGQREALVLFHIEGSSYEDIARTLDVPMGTVMTWLHRGRRRLASLLEEPRQGAKRQSPSARKEGRR